MAVTEEQIAAFKEAFTANARMAVGDFEAAAAPLGLGMTEDDLAKVTGAYPGGLDCTKFLDIVKSKVERGEVYTTRTVMWKAFVEYDKDGSGNVTPEEFKKVFDELGFDWTLDQAADYIKRADLDGDGTLSYQEYLKN